MSDSLVTAEVERKLQALQRWVIGGMAFILLLGIAMVAFVGWTAAGQIRSQQSLIESQQRIILQGKEAHDGILALKKDLQIRRDSLVKYMREHPEEEPIPGITRAQLKQSLKNYNNTLDALSVVKDR